MRSLPRCASIVAALALAALPSLRADVITLVASDSNGTTTSFNGNQSNHWSNSLAPSASNDYVVGEFILRTPNDGGSYSFAGNSLTIQGKTYPNGFLFKGTGTAGVITVNNLILDGGLIAHANGIGDLMQLTGNLNVLSASEIRAKQGPITISSSISGSADLTIGITDGGGARIVTFSGSNTYTGNVHLTDGTSLFTLANSGNLNFVIGASGVNNSVSGGGVATFNGSFDFDLSSASANVGDSWTISSAATTTYGSTFSVAGFSKSGTGWTDGTYAFVTATSLLKVIPEPSTYAMVFGLGAIGAAIIRRRRRA